MLKPIIGKTENVSRRMVKRVEAGSEGPICAIWPCTRCRALRMSTSQRKKTLISVEPRPVMERTLVMPGTTRIVCSSGRVTVSIWISIGANRDTRKIRLRENGNGQAENENDAGEREAQRDQQQRPAMRLDEVRQAPGHGSFSAFSPLPASFLPASPVLTWAPSGRL